MPYLDTKAAELLFRHKVIRLLDKEGLLSQEHTGFSAHDAPWASVTSHSAALRIGP